MVKAVSVRIIMLFNPVGAILEALEAIYRVLRWIFVNAARIFHLIETIVNGIADIIAGSIGGMANAIELALAGLIPPVIDFLADYLGVGDLPNKIRDTIIGFQEWIEGLLDEAIGWLVEKGKALLQAVGLGGDDKKPDNKGKGGEQVGQDVSWTVNNETHHLWVEIVNGTAVAYMASGKGDAVLNVLDTYSQHAADLAKEDPDAAAEVKALIPQARDLANGLNAAAADLEKTLTTEENKDAPAADAQKKESVVEGKENALRTVVAEIQTKLGLNDEADIKKARDAYPSRLFSTPKELAPLLNVSIKTAQRRVAKWIASGALFRLESAESDPLGLNSFDPIKAGQRPTDPNNRFKYGYINPKKTSTAGLIILTKGLRPDSPFPPHPELPDYHEKMARYDSKRGWRDFRFDVAVLGHHVDYGASDHWEKEGHKQTRDDNTIWNQNPDNYDGPEHEKESAASGPKSKRYIVPCRAIGSNDCWL